MNQPRMSWQYLIGDSHYEPDPNFQVSIHIQTDVPKGCSVGITRVLVPLALINWQPASGDIEASN